MSKLIYITESQLQEIIGNGSYLNDKDNTNEYRFGGAEITVGGTTGNYTDGDIETAKPVTTDKFAKQLTKQRVRGMGGEPGNYLRRNIIPESNQDLTGKQNTFQISKKNLEDLENRLNNYQGSENNPGIKRGKNLVNKGRISYDNAYRVLDDMNNGSEGSVLDPDGNLRRELEQKIKTATNISKSNRNAKMERGENVIKSAPKTGFKGGAHTPKGKNVIGVEYQ